jgi:hypothetical protein
MRRCCSLVVCSVSKLVNLISNISVFLLIESRFTLKSSGVKIKRTHDEGEIILYGCNWFIVFLASRYRHRDACTDIRLRFPGSS